MEDYYTSVGLPRYCNDIGEIRKVYREWIKYYHPDQKNVSYEIAVEKTKELNEAYNTLNSEEKKRKYDALLQAYLKENTSANAAKENASQKKQNKKTYSTQPTQRDPQKPLRHVEKDGIVYDIYRELAVLSTSSRGWSKEINVIAWNNYSPKYDIRDWSPNHERAGKGVTLSREECLNLYRLLKRHFESRRKS